MMAETWGQWAVDALDAPRGVVQGLGVSPLRAIQGITDPSKRVTSDEFSDAFARGMNTLVSPFGLTAGRGGASDTALGLLTNPWNYAGTGLGAKGVQALNLGDKVARAGVYGGRAAREGAKVAYATGKEAAKKAGVTAAKAGVYGGRAAREGGKAVYAATPTSVKIVGAGTAAGLPVVGAANYFGGDAVDQNFEPPTGAMPLSSAMTDAGMGFPDGQGPNVAYAEPEKRFVQEQTGSSAPQREIPDLPPEFAARVAARAAGRSSPSLSAAMVTPESMEATRKKVMGQRDAYLANQRQNVENRRNEARMNPFPYGSPGRLAQFAELAGIQARGDQEMKQLMAQQQFDRPFRQEQADILRAKMGQDRDLSMAELFQRENESLRSHRAGSERMAQERAMADDRNILNLLNLMMSNNINPYQAEQIALERRGMDLKEQLQQAQLRNAGMLPQPEGTEATPEQATGGGSSLGWGVPVVAGGSYLANKFPPVQQILNKGRYVMGPEGKFIMGEAPKLAPLTRMQYLRQLAGGPARMMGRVPGPWWAKAGAALAAPFIWDYMTTPTEE